MANFCLFFNILQDLLQRESLHRVSNDIKVQLSIILCLFLTFSQSCLVNPVPSEANSDCVLRAGHLMPPALRYEQHVAREQLDCIVSSKSYIRKWSVVVSLHIKRIPSNALSRRDQLHSLTAVEHTKQSLVRVIMKVRCDLASVHPQIQAKILCRQTSRFV